LHVEAIDFVHAVGQALQLAANNLEVARIVPSSIRRTGWTRTHFRPHLIQDTRDATQLLMQTTHGALQIGELPTVGFQHTRVV
jgi:hypothetical protein